jgi:tetratricopeptide (TPR) repeat protein
MNQQKINNAGIAVYELATCYRDSGDFAQAVHYYSDAIDLLKDARTNLRGCILYDRAIAHDFCSNFDEATADFENALMLFEEFIDSERDDPAIPNFKILTEQVTNQLEIRRGFDFAATNYLSAVNPRRWNQDGQPLRVFIDGSQVSGFKTNFREQIWNFISEWRGELIRFDLVESESEAQIIVKRTVDRSLVPLNAGARTIFQPTSASSIEKAHIFVLCEMTDFDLLDTLSQHSVCAVTLHETGHALGLDGHSPFGTDAMYWKSQLLEISPRDRQTISLLYE